MSCPPRNSLSCPAARCPPPFFPAALHQILPPFLLTLLEKSFSFNKHNYLLFIFLLRACRATQNQFTPLWAPGPLALSTFLTEISQVERNKIIYSAVPESSKISCHGNVEQSREKEPASHLGHKEWSAGPQVLTLQSPHSHPCPSLPPVTTKLPPASRPGASPCFALGLGTHAGSRQGKKRHRRKACVRLASHPHGLLHSQPLLTSSVRRLQLHRAGSAVRGTRAP